MSNPEARIALAQLIANRMAELGIKRPEFMKLAGFTTKSSFGSYLAGFSKLNLWQVPRVAKALQLDERQILMMCLAQEHDSQIMSLFQRHMRSQKRGKPASEP